MTQDTACKAAPRKIVKFTRNNWSRRSDLNRRPADYEEDWTREIPESELQRRRVGHDVPVLAVVRLRRAENHVECSYGRVVSRTTLALGLSRAGIVVIAVKHVGIIRGVLLRLRRLRRRLRSPRPYACWEPAGESSGPSVRQASCSEPGTMKSADR